MKQFNVWIWNPNFQTLESMDIVPWLLEQYKVKSRKRHRRVTDDAELRKWITGECMHRFWSRCEYETVVSGFPRGDKSVKVDVWNQIELNLDLLVDTVKGLIKYDKN